MATAKEQIAAETAIVEREEEEKANEEMEVQQRTTSREIGNCFL
jgi:hypothetical protein